MTGEDVSRSLPPALFDFEKAVAIARADFPAETKNVTFIDMSLPDAEDRLRGWMASTDPLFRAKYFADGTTVEDFIETSMANRGFNLKDAVTGATIVAARSRAMPGSYIFPDNAKDLAYTFVHELGHGIAQNGIPRMMLELVFQPAEEDCWEMLKQINLAENVADTFAAVYGVSKGWLDDKGDLGRLAFGTTITPWFSANLTHFTTIAIDNLAQTIGDLKVHSLTPQEISAIATRHAEEFSPAQDELMNTSEEFAQRFVSAADCLKDVKIKPGEDIDVEALKEAAFNRSLQITFENLAEAYLNAPRNTLLYYIAYRTLGEVAQTGRLKNLDHDFDVSGPFWDNVRATMMERSAEETTQKLLSGIAEAKQEITRQHIDMPGIRQYTPAGHRP